MKSFVLPLLFSILFIPVIYLIVLREKYKSLLHEINRYNFLNKSRKRKIKIGIFRHGNINLDKLTLIRSWDKTELQDNPKIFNYINILSKRKV